MAKKKPPHNDQDEVPARLRQLQEMLGHDTDAAMAAAIDVSPQRWNNYLNGTPLSKEIAFRLVRRVPGLTLDWLYFGLAGGLSVDLARRLRAIEPGKGTTV